MAFTTRTKIFLINTLMITSKTKKKKIVTCLFKHDFPFSRKSHPEIIVIKIRKFSLNLAIIERARDYTETMCRGGPMANFEGFGSAISISAILKIVFLKIVFLKSSLFKIV